MVDTVNMFANTCPFNATHHPALSLNSGFVQGLPVGLQLVGRRWGDATVLQAAYHIERLLEPLQTAKLPHNDRS
jgi:Asp-tRNA(Asn)/Glu-tRNA(Gln) amidotransferase A subunit family amidase